MPLTTSIRTFKYIMGLSSNWSNLISSKQVTVKKQKKRIQRKDYNGALNGNKKPQGGSKIMKMVYDMNKAIEKSAQDKLDGKEFEFKEENAAGSLMTEEFAKDATSDAKKTSIGKYISIDCEFVGVGPEGKQSALARVSLVNFFGHVILDKFVRPTEQVTDWRTWVSGVKPSDMINAITFKEAQAKTADILTDRILVGHAVKHDLDALMISHPKSMIRDTARHLPFRAAFAAGKSPSLKKLSKEVLKIDIQDRQHSSVEDARATMLIYKKHKKEFEKLHRKKFGSKY